MAENESGIGFPAPHPGRILREDVLPELGMTVESFARHLGVRRPGLSDLLNGRKPISQEMAIRLGKALGTGARYWLALQMQYDLSHDVPRRAAMIDVRRIEGFQSGAA